MNKKMSTINGVTPIPTVQGDFIVKFHIKLQCFCVIIHVLSVLYRYRTIHNDKLIDIKLKSVNNPDLQT